MDFRLMNESEIRCWYTAELCTAFVPQECKPLADIFHLLAENRYEIWGLFEDSLLLGYAALWKSPEVPLILLDYLGVTAARRNAGLGAAILALLKAQGRSLILESELVVESDAPQENELRLRRQAFYRRNGFQDAYPMATCGMAWQAMLFDPTHAPVADIQRWHRALYGSARRDVIIPLPDGVVPALPYWVQ